MEGIDEIFVNVAVAFVITLFIIISIMVLAFIIVQLADFLFIIEKFVFKN